MSIIVTLVVYEFEHNYNTQLVDDTQAIPNEDLTKYNPRLPCATPQGKVS